VLKENSFYGRLGKLFKTENKFYFYDLGTGKIFECSEDEYVILQKILSSQDIEEILNLDSTILNRSLNILVDTIEKEFMLQAPPLKSFSGDQTLNLEDNLNRELKQIILDVTEKCNLRCKYCIYGDNNEKFRDFSSMDDMSLETALKSINDVIHRVGDEFYVTFYGGEPLINYTLIKSVVEYVLSLDLDTKLHFSITTNLTLMTKEIAKFISSVDNFSVVCSIDGDKLTHDEYRKDISGNGSYDRTIRGLECLYNELKKEGKEDHILFSTVITPPYSKEKLDRVQNFFRTCPYIDEKTSIITSYVDYGRKIFDKDLNQRQHYKDAETFMHDNNPVQLWAEGIIEKDDFLDPFTWNGILQNFQKIHSRRISGRPMKEYILNGCCNPGGRKLFVSVDGSYNVCERMGETPSIGNVNDGYNFERIKKYYVDDYCEASKLKCKNCWAVHLCSICYAVCYDKNGIDPIMKDYKCISERFGIENYLKLYHEILDFKPSIVKDLNKMKLS
jgi:uncharacterized protein